MTDQINTLEETKTGVTIGDESEMGQAKLANLDDNVLLAQGHAPVLKRTFDLLGSLGLGFRYDSMNGDASLCAINMLTPFLA